MFGFDINMDGVVDGIDLAIIDEIFEDDQEQKDNNKKKKKKKKKNKN